MRDLNQSQAEETGADFYNSASQYSQLVKADQYSITLKLMQMTGGNFVHAFAIHVHPSIIIALCLLADACYTVHLIQPGTIEFLVLFGV